MNISNVSRRHFLTTSATFVLGAAIPSWSVHPNPSNRPIFSPNLWVGIDPDGTVTVTSHRTEMGQGIRTAIAQIVADELEADWAKVQVIQSPGDKIYGDQNTDGSQSIRLFFDILRTAGASAKSMLTTAAADKWNVPVSEIQAKNHQVIHNKTGRNYSYGELAEDASKLPVPETVVTKDRKDFRFIGKGMQHVDAKDIARGQAHYGADIKLPNMAVAVIVRCPHLGCSVKTVSISPEAESNKAFIGLEKIDPTPGAPLFLPVGGVAVIAEDTYNAMKIAETLEIIWSDTPNDIVTTPAFTEALRNAVHQPGKVVHESGTTDAIFATNTPTVEATYETPFYSHAPMEPPTALADVQGDKVLVRAPVQDPQSTRGLVAQWMETDESNVTVLPTLLGGAFGRKSKPDYVLEAVELSKRLKRPIRVQWSRENDIHHDYFHAASAQFMKATLGDDGKPNAWLQRTAFPTITTTFSDQALDPAEWELEMGFTNTPYQLANQRFEATGLKPGVRVGWMRSVCNIFHSFSANSFVDELANAANADPINYRFSLWPEKGILSVPGMQPPEGHGLDIGRMRDVLGRVRKLSRWDEPREPGVGLGVAIHHSFRSYVATVIEVRASNTSYTVDNAYVVLDCGTHINTDTCVAQMEGAVIFGLSLAQQTEITMSDGSVDQSNFDDYPVLRMPQGPTTLVEIVESDALPAGVGEPGVPPVAPALVNAIFAATGKRIRKLPIQLT